ncbi:MAG: OsmC family protein [Planktomarina sp.]
MAHEHSFHSLVRWTGNQGTGNKTYKGYARTWQVETPGKQIIECSNDPLLGGDATLHNPEDLLIATVASCHMLWYLHLAHTAGVVVTGYQDIPEGVGESEPSGAGRFIKAILRPQITLAAGTDIAMADAVHGEIHKVCFIARSVNFPITIEATYTHDAA